MEVGDYVIPTADGPDVPDSAWTPCRVLNMYKNGNLRARSDNGDILWTGPALAFQVVPKRS